MNLSFIVPAVFLFSACNNEDNSANRNNEDGDKALQQLSDEFLKGYLNWRPQSAVALGFHEFNASDATKIEKIFGSYAFSEGWVHYCEPMMLDEGFGNNGDSVQAAKYRLAQSGDALLRICRLCVSVKMHCQGMSVDEGTKFFMDNWYQGDKPSRQ